MKKINARFNGLISAAAFSMLAIGAARAASVDKITVFASGTALGATAPDSITAANGTIWVSYGNKSDSTGLSGDSTVVAYDLTGKVLKTFTLKGSVDGLKYDPETGLIWALQNQDGNSSLTLIDPKTYATSKYQYAVQNSARGYDDVVFLNGKIYLSYTNPTGPSDPTIQLLTNRVSPLTVSTILEQGATGENLATGQTSQATTQNDPDSLKSTPFGGLMLTSGDDGQLIFVQSPGTPQQWVSFLQLIDATGAAVKGLDDAIWALTPKGTLYVTDTSNNRVLKIQLSGIQPASLFASVGSLNVVGNIDLNTGTVIPLVTDLKGPHGLLFVPDFSSLFGH